MFDYGGCSGYVSISYDQSKCTKLVLGIAHSITTISIDNIINISVH